MPECPAFKTCAFLNKAHNTTEKNFYKYKYQYCLNKNSNCARLIVARFLGINFVPNDLLPNEMTKAEEIINNT